MLTGNEVRLLRTAANITVKQLARELGITHQLLIGVEHGQAVLSPELSKQLIKIISQRLKDDGAARLLLREARKKIRSTGGAS